MYALVHPFVQIALLRMKPQDLPWSPLLLWLALAAHWLLGVVVNTFRMALPGAVLSALLGTLLLAALTASLLYLNRLGNRLMQTLTALAGTDVVVGFVLLPVFASLHGNVERSAAGGVPGLLLLMLLAWSLAVTGHVLRHALGAPFPLGVVIALVFYVISVTVINALFPGVA